MTFILLLITIVNSVTIYFLWKKVNIIFTGVQQGDINRKWKGWWKIKPEDHKKIYLDTRTCEKIAKEYGVSPSHISKIKREYAIKQK